MRSYHHDTTFAGFPVLEWSHNAEIVDKVDDPSKTAFAIRLDWDDSPLWQEKFETLMVQKYAPQIPAIIIGAWEEPYDITSAAAVELVAANRDRLQNLKAIFVGEITADECEISWIRQSNLSVLFNAFPQIEHVVIRGGTGLRLGKLDLPRLRYLRIETGGMDGEVVRQLGDSHLPALEHIELWLGEENYGASVTLSDLHGFYEGAGMPSLKYLGLCNSDIQNTIAEFIATAPLLQRVETLDMSMGVLTDEGALALLKSPYIHNIKALKIHHHFVTDAMIAKMKELSIHGINVQMDDQQDLEGRWRFVAVGE